MKARRFRRHPPKYPNLRAYMTVTGDTQATIAAAVGTSQAHISRILAGKSAPRGPLAMRLAEYCQIPLDSFMVEVARQKGAVA